MFKFVGGILIVVASFAVFNQKIFIDYFTVKFLKTVISVIEKLEYEKNSNITYDIIFSKLNFNWEEFIICSRNNRYIVCEEIDAVTAFFTNLGKRDFLSEEKYIQCNLDSFTAKQNSYYKKLCANQKVYAVCGISFGLFIVIFLI